MRVISLNCQGLRDRQKHLRLIKWLHNQNFNIAFLQEIHFTNNIEKDIYTDFASVGNVLHSYGNWNSRGVSIVINNKCDVKIENMKTDENGRFLLLNAETLGLIEIHFLRKSYLTLMVSKMAN